MLEVSRLVFLVAASFDGKRDLTEISERVSHHFGRQLSTDKLAYLIEHKLVPLGIIGEPGEALPTASPRARARPFAVGTAVIPARAVRAATGVLRPLFWPLVIVAVLVGVVAFDLWMWFGAGTGDGVRQVLRHPGLLLAMAALTIVAGGFHELGHATACRFGGAEPGVIGVGICVIWPAFYNDLNDSYRLDRVGRLRADLGGIYFNVVLILITAAGFAVTGYQPMLVMIVYQHLLAAQQLLPFARLDGYYIVSDLAGVPNLFSRAPSIIASLVPGRTKPKKASELTVKARAIVATWAVGSAALLAATAVLVGPRLPHYWQLIKLSAVLEATTFRAAVRAGALTVALVTGVQLLILAVPVIAAALALARIGGRLVGKQLGGGTISGGEGFGVHLLPDDSNRARARVQLERIIVQNADYEKLPEILDILL